MMYKDFTPVVRGFAGGGFGVLTGMLTSVSGAMIFSSTDCGGFHLSEATKVAAIGEGLLLGTVNALSSSASQDFFNKIISSSAQIALRIFSNMLGCAIESAISPPKIMPDEMAAIVVIGATVMVIPMWVINMRASQEISTLVDSVSVFLNTQDRLNQISDLKTHERIDSTEKDDCSGRIDHASLFLSGSLIKR